MMLDQSTLEKTLDDSLDWWGFGMAILHPICQAPRPNHLPLGLASTTPPPTLHHVQPHPPIEPKQSTVTLRHTGNKPNLANPAKSMRPSNLTTVAQQATRCRPDDSLATINPSRIGAKATIINELFIC